jgi:hypothetical protein
VLSAQIVDRTTDRAKDKANNRVDQRIDQGLDKGLDAIEGAFKRKPKEKKAEEGEADVDATMAEAGINTAEAKESYAFDHQVSMTIESTNKKGEVEGVQEMDMLFSESKPDVGIRTRMEGVNSTMVLDMEAFTMIMLMDMSGQKMLMTYQMSKELFEEKMDESAENTSNATFKKTGRTKQILGYTCEEYLVEDEDYTSELWVTKEENFGIAKAFQGMAAQKQQKGYPSDYPAGMVMEMISYDKKNSKEKTHMLVVDIQKNKKQTISTKGYMKMGFGG